MTDKGLPEIRERELMHQGAHLEMHRIHWRGADGEDRLWESAERVGGRQAVLVVPLLLPSHRLVLIRQYRPPAERFIIEFPAGLVDPGEAPEETALRELREETGYQGIVRHITPPTYTTPGLTSETVCQVRVDIEEDLPENRNPTPAPEGGEHIKVELVALAEGTEFFRRECETGTAFDSKVAAYLLALEENSR